METTQAKRKRVREAPEVRREQILDAAASAFVAKGVSTATMDDVAAAAGVAKGTVYLYFRSKDALVTGLVGRYGADLLRLAEEHLDRATGGPRSVGLERFVAAVVDYHFDRRELVGTLFHATSPHGDEMDRLRNMLRRYVERGIGAGEFDVPDAELAAEFVFEGIHGVLNASFHAGAPDRDRVVAALVALASKSLAYAPA